MSDYQYLTKDPAARSQSSLLIVTYNAEVCFWSSPGGTSSRERRRCRHVTALLRELLTEDTREANRHTAYTTVQLCNCVLFNEPYSFWIYGHFTIWSHSHNRTRQINQIRRTSYFRFCWSNNNTARKPIKPRGYVRNNATIWWDAVIN
jgi:hypothetical protein